MRKFFKNSLVTLALLLMLVFTAYFVILHTQKGTNWIINYLIKSTPVKIKTIEGTLASELKLIGIRFNDSSAEVQAQELSYKIRDIQWFSRKLAIEEIIVQQLDVKLLESRQETTVSKPFEGLNLPFELEVHGIKINNIAVNSGDNIHKLKQVKLAVFAKNQEVMVSGLSIAHQNFLFEGSVDFVLFPNLPYKLNTSLKAFDEENSLKASGEIQGDLSQIALTQVIDLTRGTLTGELSLNADVDLRNKIPALNVSLLSKQLALSAPDQPTYHFESFKTTLTGALDSYQLSSDLLFSSEGIEKSTLAIEGIGDLDSINLRQIDIVNPQGTIKLPTVLNWKDSVSATTQVELLSLNPAAYLPEWPGEINGETQLSSKLSENGDYFFMLENALFNGKLKEKKFTLSGNVGIKPDDVNIKKAQIIMGNNKIDINAVVKNQKIQAELKTELKDLSSIDRQIQGSMTSDLIITGELSNPEFDGQASINGIQYQDYAIESLELIARGNWLNQFSINTYAKGISSNNKSYNSLQLDLLGNKDKHKLNLTLEDELLIIKLAAIGAITELDKFYWKGEVLEHSLYLKDISSMWALKDPLKIDYNKDINLSKACWINQDIKGNVCLDFALNTRTNKHQINLDLDQLNVRFLQLFLPKNLGIDGQLDGNAEISLLEENLSINSNFDFLDGEIQFMQDPDDTLQNYKAKITSANIKAIQEGENSKVSTLMELDDGTKLNLDLSLFKPQNNALEIKGGIEGIFKNTQYIATLTDQIDDMNGEFKLNGTIEGAFNNPTINLNAKQKQGYLVLTQTKSKIENIDLTIQQEANKPLAFSLQGLTGKGWFNSSGQFELNASNTQKSWQLNAHVKGDNMRLLTLPGLELDITPDIIIKANDKSAEITGEVTIPHAQVTIKQLPESAISSSADIEVFIDEDKIEQTDEYPVNFDVLAIFKDSVKIDVLGLVADLKGKLKVSNIQNSRINGYGSLNLLDGKYTIYGQTLDISKGELVFNGPIDNPSLDIIASRKSISGDVTAGVELGGTVNYLQSSLYSDPVLTDLEILSYILSGRGLNEDSDTSSQQLAQAAILLGLQKSSPIFSEIQSKLGIDVLTIKEGATAKDSIVEAGKQFNERLYVGYNQGLFNRIGFWVLRYRINKTLRLETTQGETQSVDLIYVRKKK